MKSVTFSKRNRSGDVLHIEVPGAVVNIRIGLTDALGRQLTRVSISPDDEQRSPDEDGYFWRLAADGSGRVIRDVVPGLHVTPDCLVRNCRYCGAFIEQGLDGLWADASAAWANPERAEHRSEAQLLACPDAPRRNDLHSGLHEPVRE
jgi:hypothetical protein